MSDNLIGATTAIFIVSLSIAVAEPVDVAWSTRDGTAKAGTDYQAANGVVTFLPGETEKQIEVIVYGQNVSPTGDKNFFINLMPPTNAVLGTALIEAVIKVEDEAGVPVTSVIVAQGRRGLKGDPGLSAYDQAVLMGYEGTVEDWMQEQADAAAAAQRAGDYAAAAASAATKAESAATAASFLGNIFPTPEAGVDPVTGVGNGAYYNVRSPDDDSYLVEYQNVGGVPTPSGKSYPSASAIANIQHNNLKDRDMAGAHPASAILDDSGLNQQDINSLLLDGLFFVEDWGAKGDGVTFDSVAINNAITELSDQFKVDNKPKLLQLKANKVYVVHNINLKAGVSLACVNGFAKLLRGPNSLGESESTMTWRRIVQPDPSSWVTDSDFECRNFIRNIIFDGNYNNVGWTFGTYNQEQASCLVLYGRNNVDAAWKRVRFDLSNLIFMNSVSDGLHVVNDADVTFNNLYAERCFRGGLVITGGNSIVRGRGMVSNDARTDIEIDSRGFGNTFKSYVYVSDFYQDVGYTKTRLFGGGFDLGTIGGGVLHLNNVNVHSTPLNCYFALYNNEIPEKYIVENSVFHMTAEPWINPTDCTFRNTKFVFRNDLNAEARLAIYGAYANYIQDSEVELLFDSCDFELFDRNIARTTANVTVESQNRSSKAWVKFLNCDLSRTASTGYDFWGSIGGKIWVDGCKVGSTSFIGGAATIDGYPLKLKVGLNTYLPTVQKFMSLAYSEASQVDNEVEFLPNCLIPQSINYANSFNGQNQVPPIRKGRRLILGTTPPTSATVGYNGDIYEVTTKESGKPFRWVCVSPKVSFSSAVWQPIDIPLISTSVTYDPPSIAAGSFATTTVTLNGAELGSVAQAAFDQYSADIEISAVVSAINTVTVKFKNTGASPVDLASGTLTVKLK